MLMAAPSEAEAQSRTLNLYHVHNRERASIVYRRGSSYDQAGLKKVNMMLRDWRKNQPTKMDPRVLDVLWEVYQRSGAKGDIHIIGGYRSPATNSMLRSRSKGVAKNSQHTLGKAIDFYIPGVPLKKLRDIGLQLQAGGVGYYPSSGSPFVHMDVGNVRHWPRISQSELASIMSKGSKIGSGGTMMASNTKRSGGFLSAFFGRGAQEEDGEGGEETVVAAAPVKRPAAPPAQTARAKQALPGIEIVPPDQATPAVLPQAQPEAVPAPVEEKVIETPETIIAALPARKVPVPAFAPRPQVDVGPATVALAEAVETTAAAAPAGPVPAADVPFAVKPAAEEATDVALGIPLPTWRPEHKAAKQEVDSTALLALASTDVADDASALVAPIPGDRPAFEAAPAAVPTPAPARQQRLAARPQPASAKTSAVTTASIEPVKTTRKDARPDKAAAKPTAKPVVVAAQPTSARWAIDKNYVAAKSKPATGTSFAYNVVRTAPVEVYTAGFQQGADASDMNRFTGKAVEFLSVARFGEK